ncbi:bifunctional diguanylate cyclase/phosphodiesterase [Nocardioides stalactiti]|uniref:bifunctional diguanylate cyclase/phosphodiesterase n=1 Tax=Nocardioides stalactiti TaxID=2755356 RepID=UPI0015FF9F4D|nr:bifunctional diguanylate cyclase/phosphodiesterase [Nocardioides stalactiti]
MGAGGRIRTEHVVLGAGLMLVAAFVVLHDSHAGTAVYLACGAYGTLLSFFGAARMAPARRRIWWAIALSQALFLLGDATWTVLADVLHVEPFPSVADVWYLVQYPVLALGMVWLVRGRQRGRDRAAFLDAAILTTGFTVTATVFFIVPAATSDVSLLSRMVAAAYPACDLLVLAVLLRVLTTGILRNASLWALIIGVGTLLAADLHYAVTVVLGTGYPGWIDAGYLVSYVLLGFAPLHHSAGLLSEPAPERPTNVNGMRATVLVAAALILAPLTRELADQDDGGLWLVVMIGGGTAAVLVVLRLGDIIRDLQATAVQLAALARRDELTGIANRRTWDHELSRACAVACALGTPLTVAMLDLDHFKAFNDTYGHLKGDLVLKETTAAWSSVLDGRGMLARYGGEEFTALVPALAAEEAVTLLDRLRRLVTHRQTCSIGIATWDGVENPADLVARADRALYAAKAAGRDRIAVDDGRRAQVVANAATAHPLMASMSTVYQPIVELRSGRVIGREALSRFPGQDPRAVFDRAARDGTSAVLESEAVRRAIAGWDGGGLLSVNTSPDTLLTAELGEALPIDLTGIVLEITESDLMDYTSEVMLAISGMRARGAMIAIDDFGAGFSNFQRVVAIRPDIVKLDRSLVQGIDVDPMLQAAVGAARVFAEQTGATVVAEGIETPAERECLTHLGVTLGQGYLLGRPAPLPVAAPASR